MVLLSFVDHDGHNFHMQFQKWRQANLDGFYLNFKSKRLARLHRVECAHAGPPSWDGSVGVAGAPTQSLTRSRKIGAASASALLAWAERESVEVKRCLDCAQNLALPSVAEAIELRSVGTSRVKR